MEFDRGHASLVNQQLSGWKYLRPFFLLLPVSLSTPPLYHFTIFPLSFTLPSHLPLSPFAIYPVSLPRLSPLPPPPPSFTFCYTVFIPFLKISKHVRHFHWNNGHIFHIIRSVVVSRKWTGQLKVSPYNYFDVLIFSVDTRWRKAKANCSPDSGKNRQSIPLCVWSKGYRMRVGHLPGFIEAFILVPDG